MAIKKQEFYEGAALHLLARNGKILSIKYAPPFFLLNDTILVTLKYSTKARSPWGFTFTSDEQDLLQKKTIEFEVIIGLICGSDGVAALPYDSYRKIAAPRHSAVHIACHRNHGQHYEINGPDGILPGKVAPSNWQKILHTEVTT